MQKTLSWLTGLATGGLIVVALNVYWNHHPDLFRRFTPEIKPAEHASQESDEDIASEETEPVHFLGEQAVAQEYYKRADLPFNLAPAGFAKPDKPEEDEDTSPPHAPKNRLPGKITFEDEPQEPLKVDMEAISRRLDGDWMPRESSDTEELSSLIISPSLPIEEGAPKVMKYCEDEENARAEMPYAEEEIEVKDPKWDREIKRQIFSDREDQKLWDDIQEGFYDVEGRGDKTVGRARLDLTIERARLQEIQSSGMMPSAVSEEQNAFRQLGLPDSRQPWVGGLFLNLPLSPMIRFSSSQSGGKEEIPQEIKTQEPAGKESDDPPIPAGFRFSFGWGWPQPNDPMVWREFIGSQKNDEESPYKSRVFGDLLRDPIVAFKEAIRGGPIAFQGYHDYPGCIPGNQTLNVEKNFFNLPETLPWIDTSLENPNEKIDTIWPLNLSDKTDSCLLSKLMPQYLNRCGGDVNYPEAMRKVLDKQDHEYLRKRYPLLNRGKPNRISSEELISCVESALWPWNLLCQPFWDQLVPYESLEQSRE